MLRIENIYKSELPKYNTGFVMPRFKHLSKCRVRKMADAERGFVAGLIEGDGCISLIKRKRNTKSYKRGISIVPMIMIANTDIRLLEKIKNIIGRGWVYKIKTIQKPSDSVRHKKLVHRYSLENLRDVKFVLEQILDLLVSYKRERAKIIINYCNRRISRL